MGDLQTPELHIIEADLARSTDLLSFCLGSPADTLAALVCKTPEFSVDDSAGQLALAFG